MEFTNPHFSPAPDQQHFCDDHADATRESMPEAQAALPRLRKVTNSPAREYAARPGEVIPLSDNIAALILSYKGRAQVQRNGIKVDRKELSDMPLFYWHEDSITCQTLQGEKIYYVLNPNTLDCVHIMDANGRYIETVPLKGSPAILDYEAASKEIAKHRRYMTRQQSRLQELHGEDTTKILERHRANTEAMTRATQLLPAEDTSTESAAPQRETTADQIADRAQHIQQHINQRRDQAASAASIGRAAREEISTSTPTTRQPREPAAEDWSTPARSTPTPSQEPEPENW